MQPMKTQKLFLSTGIGLWPFAALCVFFSLINVSTVLATPPQNKVVATVTVGALPGSLVCSPDNAFVYVVISGGIAVINTSTNQLTATYSLPGMQTFLAISPNGQTLYASDIANTGNGVQVISASTGALSTLIPFPFPTDLKVTPDGTQLWVCNSTNDPTTGGIYIVDTATNSVSASPILVANTAPKTVLFSPNGTTAYAIYAQIPPNLKSYLVQIDVSNDTVLNANFAGKALHAKGLNGPVYLSIHPNDRKIYANELNVNSFLVNAVVLSTKKAKTIYAPTGQHSISAQAITPGGAYLYLVEPGNGPNLPGTVVSISSSTGALAGPTAAVGVNPTGIALSPNGKFAYVSNNTDGTVTVIDIQP